MKIPNKYTLSVSYKRLMKIIKKGDIIYVCPHGVGTPGNFRITHVDWWGVYVMPTEDFLNSLSEWRTKENIKEIKKHGHFKIKWGQVWKITLKKDL